MIAIVFRGGPLDGERLELDREMTFGRSGCDVTLDDPEVSRRHLTLRPAGAELHVEDMGSSNGTLVDGHRIEGTVSAEHGSVIQVGASELLVELPEEDVRTKMAPAMVPTAASNPIPPPAAPDRVAPAAPAPPAQVPVATAPATTAPAGGLPAWFWTLTGVVEIALILTAAVLLVYYAAR